MLYQKIAAIPFCSCLVAKCSSCHNEYPAQRRECPFCKSEQRDWVIDLSDMSHNNKRKKWWKK